MLNWVLNFLNWEQVLNIQPWNPFWTWFHSNPAPKQNLNLWKISWIAKLMWYWLLVSNLIRLERAHNCRTALPSSLRAPPAFLQVVSAISWDFPLPRTNPIYFWTLHNLSGIPASRSIREFTRLLCEEVYTAMHSTVCGRTDSERSTTSFQ